jgi:hypothetical protein
MMRIGALACLVAVARAQSKAPPRGGGAAPCPTGWSRGQHDCEPDACNINRIKPPRHGSMGNCATREFEFLHTRPDPVDDTEVTIASLQGALATVGIDFDRWGPEGDFEWADGAVFWSSPEDGPSGSATVAQITVPSGGQFHAILNFQGKTTTTCDDLANDGDSNDGCLEGDSWQEFDVHFTNSNHVDLYRTYRWVTPQVLVIQRDSVPGFTTYRLVVQLSAEARNIYAVFGTGDHHATLPAAYQEADPFGADIGGTHSSFWQHEPTSQYDSFVTLGEIDMEHPDIVDNVRMLASGTECELACDDGYEIVGAQPSCTAGAVTFSASCRCNTDETCSREALPTVPVGEEDLALYAPEAPDPAVRPHPPPRTDVAAAAAEEPPMPLVQEAPEAVTVNVGAVVVGGAVGVLVLLGVAKSLCCSKPSISPQDVAAVTKMAPVDPGARSMEVEGKVETTDNSLFSGMTIGTF